MANSVVQTIKDAEVDARSLSEFMYKPLDYMVSRRLADPIHTLNYYLEKFDSVAVDGEIKVNNFVAKAEQAIKDAQMKAGYVIAGTFAEGATLNNYNDAISDSDGNLYRWGGDLPKTVTANSTPENTGGFGRNAWIEISSSLIRDELNELKNGVTQYHYTQMGKAFDSSDGANDPYASWPHANVDYDESTDNFVIFYNTNTGHSISTNSVLMRTKPAEADVFSDPAVVASDKGNYSYKTQASGIAANGDYISLVAEFAWEDNNSYKTWVYRSSDKGQNWSRVEMRTSAGDLITAFNGDVSGFLVTLSGRILTFAVEPETYLTRIFYSDDNGETWEQSAIEGDRTDITEPAWCDLGNGKLVCYARAAVRTGKTTHTIPAKYMTSIDNGTTWSLPVASQSITNYTLSNGELIPDYEQKTVEFLHHSRRTEPDGFSSLLRSWGTFEDAFNDAMKPQIRVGKLTAYIAYEGESATGDSGYIGAAKSKNGVINGFYYNGMRNNAQINYVVGLPNTKRQSNILIDYKTGLPPVNKADNGTGVDSSEVLTVYNNGRYDASWHLNFYLVADSEERIDYIYLNTPATAERPATGSKLTRIFGHTPINVDNLDYIAINIEHITPSDKVGNLYDVDFGLCLYDAPASSGKRKAVAFISESGYLALDTKDLMGDLYLCLQLGSRQAELAEVKINKIDLCGQGLKSLAGLPKPQYTYWENGADFLGQKGFTVTHDAYFKNYFDYDVDIVGKYLSVESKSIHDFTDTTAEVSKAGFLFNQPIPSDTRVVEAVFYNTDIDSVHQNSSAALIVSNGLTPASIWQSGSGVVVKKQTIRDTKDGYKLILDINDVRKNLPDPNIPLYIGVAQEVYISTDKPTGMTTLVNNIYCYK